MIERKSKILIILGIFLFSFRYFDSYKYEIINKEKIGQYFNNQKEIKKDEYIAVLEIPKINLKRGIYDKTSLNNNVDKNIYVVKETTFPNEENSQIILAAHSGYGYQAFFNDLNKLNLNDEIYFYYNGNKYIYKIIDVYEIDKTGKIDLDQIPNSIVLITCIYNTNKQITYIGKMISKFISTPY